MMNRSYMNGWQWFWGVLMMVIFWGGIVAAIVFAVRSLGSTRGTPEHPDAKGILRNRYARGEISEDEFEERMNFLNSRAA